MVFFAELTNCRKVCPD